MKQQLKQTGEAAYFAASNSRGGFHSYYEHCFRRRVDRLFCIKGGPGTGKSTFMRAVAREGARHGYRVETYYCSSDADSLDGVLLFGKTDSIGLLDATSPHAFEPSIPGAREEIVDLGQFWDGDMLALQESDIVRLNRQKADGYRAAYHYLSGVGELSDALRERMTPCLDMPKLERTAHRLMRDTGGRSSGVTEIRLRSSIGMAGHVQLDTYLHMGERLCLIEDYHDSAYTLTGMLAQMALEARLDVRLSYHPVLPDRIDALHLCASKTTFAVCSSDQVAAWSELMPHARVIAMRRMTDRERLRDARGEIRRADKLREALLEGAGEQFAKVAQAHFSLEAIYTHAMDFSAKERYTTAFCHRLFADTNKNR